MNVIVDVGEGSSHCTLSLLWKNSKMHFSVGAYDPSGNVVSENSNIRYVTGDYPYNFYEIDNPIPEKWTVEVEGNNVAATQFRTIGFEVNKNVRLEVSNVKSQRKIGESIKPRARA